MKEWFHFSYSIIHFIYGVLGAIALFFILRFIKHIIRLRLHRPVILQILQLAEVFIWLIFFLTVLSAILPPGLYYELAVGLLFLVVALLLVWFILRDYLAGLLLKLHESPLEGKEIQIDNQQGIIENCGYLYLILRTPEGERLYLPYSRVYGHTFILQAEKKGVEGFILIVQLPEQLDRTIFEKQIRRFLLSSPEVLPDSEIRIKWADNDPQNKRLEVNLKLVSEMYLTDLQKRVQRWIDNMSPASD